MLPDLFIKEIEGLFPGDGAALLRALGEMPASVSVRVNSARGASVPEGAAVVPWCGSGFYLAERAQFTFDPLWHAGMYYVQDASSMFIHHVIKSVVKGPVRYLDLCAAPGGKTTSALQSLPSGSVVVANEIVGSRARVRVDNVMRWGNPSCAVTSCTPRQMGELRESFDVISADVPCSGEGMFRKEADAVSQWSPSLVEQCAERQRSIIADVWSALRPGGLFIYSTCTFNTKENERMVEHIVEEYGAEAIAVPTESSWGIHCGVGTGLPCYRFLPHLTRGEGLFMAVLRKPEGAVHTVKAKKQRPPQRPSVPVVASQWLADAENYRLSVAGDSVVAVPRQHAQFIDQLGSCNLLHAGITVGTIRGKNVVPSQSLALSNALARNAVSECELDYRQSISYLRGEVLSVDAPRGCVAVTYKGAVLGWVNNLGNRANNLYPRPLRILSTHIPDTPPRVL